jgi:E3 ubiquitin-protein ligase TRIP12
MQDEELDTSPVEIDDALMIDDDDISDDDDDDDDDDDHEVTVCKLNAPLFFLHW